MASEVRSPFIRVVSGKRGKVIMTDVSQGTEHGSSAEGPEEVRATSFSQSDAAAKAAVVMPKPVDPRPVVEPKPVVEQQQGPKLVTTLVSGGKPDLIRHDVVFKAGNMWMIFCEGGVYQYSDNIPGATLKQLQDYQAQGGTVNRVYFLPNSDSYIVTDGKTATQFQNPPADVWAAVQEIGGAIRSLSWVGDGMWALFGANQYRLGASASAVQAAIDKEVQSGTAADDVYSPNLVVFAPSGEWMLQGYGQRDEGNPTLDFSPNFPQDIQQTVNALPDHVEVLNLEFDPAGGWIMVDDQNNVHYSASGVEQELQNEVTTLTGGGNVVVDFACLALNQPILPFGPVEQPPPVESNFESMSQFEGLWNPTPDNLTTGFRMKSVVYSLDGSGNLDVETGLMTTTWTSGFHGTV
jgi:hypothetical protein